ncbi:hypothetical protein ABT392_21640 [Paucibacter sp. JuS9]|uniref:hypothetical protein n=1 Tax=Roseateles TaxID=93681 RepID=UPI002FE54DD0
MSMWPAWLQMLAARPQLLAEHGQAYVQLLGEESGEALAGWRRQLIWHLLAGLCLAMALLLAGTACLLAAALPLAQMPLPWLLLALPLLPLLAGLACWQQAGRAQARCFVRLRQQLRADEVLLQELLAPPSKGATP